MNCGPFKSFIFLLGLLSSGLCCVGAPDWPGWRGDGSGVAEQGQPQVSWDDGDPSVVWKTAIPGKGFSSPIVSDGRVYVTTARQGTERAVAKRGVWTVLSGLGLLTLGVGIADHRARRKGEGGRTPLTSVIPLLLLGLFCLGLFAAEVLINSEGYWASRWVSGSLSRGWLVSGFACAPGLAATVLLSRGRRGLTWIAGSVAAAQALFFLYAIPDPRLYVAESSRLVESLLAASGLVLGPMLVGRHRVWALLSGCVMVIGCAAFVGYLHLGGMPSLGSLRFKIPAGLLAASVIGMISQTIPAARRNACNGVALTPGPGLPGLCLLPLVLLLATTHFYSAHFYLPGKGSVRALVCLDLRDGAVLWETGFSADQEPLVVGNSFATPTPVTDGEHVCAYFGRAGAMGVSRTGRLLWVNRNLPLETDYGAGSSPVMDGGLLYLACDNRTDSYVTALEVATGEPRWRTSRKCGEAFSTPALVRIQGVQSLVVNGGRLFAAYDPVSGRERWSLHLAHSDETTPSLVVDRDRDIAYVGRSYANNPLTAYKLEANAPPSPLWTTREKVLGYSSPLFAKGLVYVVSNDGVARCIEAVSGKIRWCEKVGGTYTASPLMLDDRIFLLSREGEVTVLAAGTVFRKLSRFDLGHASAGSMAVAGDRILLRTLDHLWCIGCRDCPVR